MAEDGNGNDDDEADCSFGAVVTSSPDDVAIPEFSVGPITSTGCGATLLLLNDMFFRRPLVSDDLLVLELLLLL